MVHLLDLTIVDDPAIRRLQLVEVVLTHCAAVLWPKKPEKLAQAVNWATKIRHALQKISRTQTPEDCNHPPAGHHSATKTGRSGLQVASADALVVGKEARHDRTAEPTSKEFSQSRTCPNSLQNPEHATEQNRASSTGPSSKVEVKSHVDANGVYTETTAAYTAGGNEVVLVSSDGFPLQERLSIPFHDDLPLEIRQLSGGITNELFHIYDPEDVTHSAVVRVFGKETERVISRESELFYQSLFIKTYLHGTNFLVYDFLVDHETLPYTEMKNEAENVARAMALFQVQATLAAVEDFGEPLLPEDHHNVHWEVNHSASQASAKMPMVCTRFDRESNYATHSLTVWVDLLSQQEILEKVHPDKQEEFLKVAKLLRRESDWMMSILMGQLEHLGEGVCHNDLLSANIMRNRSTGALTIIDFDYTKRDFLLFDVANHFNEYTGLECDYATYFPTDEDMFQFILNYRAAMRMHLMKSHADSGREADIIPNEKALFWTDSSEEEAEVTAHWTRLTKLLTLCSNLSWSIWSLLQEAVSKLDVDFLDYAKLRLGRYTETKWDFSRAFV